jgi:myo-inositol-1(or 4)-monophosphatase
LHNSTPVAAAIYVPTEDELYVAKSGCGVFRNGKRLAVTTERKLINVLCAFGFDPTANPQKSRSNAELLRCLASGVRNIRATNSLIDFCYTLEARLGGFVNLNTKIWDIVPISLMLPEAGGKFTDLNGNKIKFRLNELEHGYAVLGGSRALHPQLRELVSRV